MSMLTIDNVHTYYGNIHALKGITLNIEQGEIVTLIGGNGAGKTTTLRTISGLLVPREGSVKLNGEDLFKCTAHEIVYKGISMVPEGRGVFAASQSQKTWNWVPTAGMTKKKSMLPWREYSISFPVLKIAAGRWQAHSPAVSSKCLPRDALSCQSQA